MGLNIRAAVKKYGYTHQDIAAKLGITETGFSQHVNGTPGLRTLQRIADAIGCDIVELFDQPDTNNTTCPHCGNSITVKIEK